MKARPLKVAKIMYIFQLMFHSSGGTPNARMQFQSQLAAVARETALARTLTGKISEGYVHEVGPQVVAKLATKRYEQATMAFETLGLSTMRQETFLSGSSQCSPYAAWSAPEMKSQDIMRKDPINSARRRPNLSRYKIAGSVMATLMMYWMDEVSSGSAMLAPFMM